MKHASRFFLSAAVAIAALGVVSCAGIDKPQGHSKGYSSARLVKVDKNRLPPFAEDSDKVNGWIQQSLASQFRSNGLSIDPNNAELVVAYLLVIQDNASTVAIDDYFGYGRDSEKILDEAHMKGVVKSDRPDKFERGAIVIDVLDAKTNKLVYRNWAVRDTAPGLSDSARRQRIDQAIAEALAPFFR